MARLIIVEDNVELASLIASAARARGHVARAVHTGQAALAALATGSFDAAVVDLLLPDVRGGELLDQLRAKSVASVAVSGVYKGDRFAREATEQHGAIAFLEKPFDMETLLFTIERATGPAIRSSEECPGPALEELHALEAITGEPDAALAEWEKVWKRLNAPRPAKRREVPSWAQAGDLVTTQVPRLLNAYFQARHDGELILKHPVGTTSVLKVVQFERGAPVYAASNLAQERFARFCARRGLMPQSELDTVSALAKEEGLRTGEAMLRLGLITEEQRRQLLEEQIKEIIWSTFSWTEGTYTFSPKRPHRVDLVKLSVFPGALILEGVMRTQTLVSLRERMGRGRRLFPTPDPPYDLHTLPLSGAQALLLAATDGTKTVDDLLTLTDLSERDGLASLAAFELLGIVEERREDDKSRRISFGL